MRGWKPRSPSPNLRNHLFPPPTATPPTQSALHPILHHGTPITLGLLAAFALLMPLDPTRLPSPTAGKPHPFLAAAFSNQFYAAYFPPVPHSHLNLQSSPNLGSTRSSLSTSSIPSLAVPQTNQTGPNP